MRTMKPSLAALLSILLLTTAGCDRSGEAPRTNDQGPLGASKLAEGSFASAQAVVPRAEPAKPAATGEAGERMSCGSAEMADGTCAGESGEAGGCSQWDEAATKVAKRETPTDAVWATIPVQGMSCGGCERRIIANLGGVDGILGVEADAELGQVRIAHAKGNDEISRDARAHIAKLGYKPQ